MRRYPVYMPSPHSNLLKLYSDHHGWLLAWLHKKLGCSQHAADLAHDTFLRIMAKQQDLPALREPRAFLTTVAHGLVVNHWRRQEIEHAYLEVLAARPELLLPSVEERQIVIETLEAIACVLNGLPARRREIFLLAQLDGLTYPQIATHLNLSINVVQKNMAKALVHCYAAVYD